MISLFFYKKNYPIKHYFFNRFKLSWPTYDLDFKDETLGLICFCISKTLLKKFKIFLFFFYFKLIFFLVFLDYFDTLISKMIFLKKNIILIHLKKNTLKSNRNHTPKQTIWWPNGAY